MEITPFPKQIGDGLVANTGVRKYVRFVESLSFVVHPAHHHLCYVQKKVIFYKEAFLAGICSPAFQASWRLGILG